MSAAVPAQPRRSVGTLAASSSRDASVSLTIPPAVDELIAVALDTAKPAYRNVYVDGRRTSVRLEMAIWRVLDEITARECCGLDQLVARAQRSRMKQVCTSTLLRCVVISYLQSAVTEEGHAAAGHGTVARG